MKTLLALLVGMVLGGLSVWLFLAFGDDPRLRRWEQQVGATGAGVRDALQDKLQVLHLRADDIQDELARTGQIVRRAARDLGQAVADATADARITAAIKARYLADARLSALRISVNCTAGRVTLSGTVSAAEDISRAMLLAMETDGVREVVSTLQVRR